MGKTLDFEKFKVHIDRMTSVQKRAAAGHKHCGGTNPAAGRERRAQCAPVLDWVAGHVSALSDPDADYRADHAAGHKTVDEFRHAAARADLLASTSAYRSDIDMPSGMICASFGK